METTTHASARPDESTTVTLLLTLDEVANELRCARRSVERQIAARRLRVVHFGRSVRVARSDLEGFIDDLRSDQIAGPADG